MWFLVSGSTLYSTVRVALTPSPTCRFPKLTMGSTVTLFALFAFITTGVVRGWSNSIPTYTVFRSFEVTLQVLL